MTNVVKFKPKKKAVEDPDFKIKPLRDVANWITLLILIGTGFALMGTSFMGIVAIICASYMIYKSEEANRGR